MKQLTLAALMALSFSAQAADVDVATYTKRDQFTDLKISPGGDYYAATVPLEDRTVLVVLDRATNKISGSFKLAANNHVSDFRWITPNRLVFGAAQKFGLLETPLLTGEVFAMDADGGKATNLSGYRVDDGGLGTTIKPKKDNDRISAFPISTVAYPADAKTVLVSVQSNRSADPYSSAERMDLYNGRRARVASSPVRDASFTTDNKGVVRFAAGSISDNIRKLFYRSGEGAEWQLQSIEKDGVFEDAIGFSADDKIAYLQVEQASGPDSIVALDLATQKRTEVLRDNDTDPGRIIYRNGTRIPIGAYFMDGKPRTAFFDMNAPEARLQRSLEAAFAGDGVVITSQTSDGRLALVQTYSDRNPGDFFLFDTVAKKASHVVSRREWFDPETQAEMQPIEVTARDGMVLHGYLTKPMGAGKQALPMVVMPHGGPFGIRDVWAFDSETQMLAKAGYAVLQLNYRGSGGYGKAYRSAGGREWGGKMQDDLTDATRWAIAQGFAVKDRICLFGGSYGAYAALMGVAKEPGLYKCAAGYVGVYDLPKLQSDAKRGSTRGGNWTREWVGNPEELAAVSPNRMADRIKVPVFLAAGGEDFVAPIEHSKMMEGALRKAGVQVETLYYDTEGHGFFKPEHQQEFYTRLLAFLSRNLGGGVATSGGGTDGKAAK
jgi:dipeptidyl aminopeptidase/acylaminoacyl peptidase